MTTDAPPSPLSEREQATLDKLLTKLNAGQPHAPAVQLGDPYIALVNLSLPRRGPVEKGEHRQSDLVMAGDTVYLTEDEAARFNRHDPDRDGRRIEVVRKKGTIDPSLPQRVHPSLLSGPVFRPGPPVRGDTGPRPDPPGSSRVIETAPVIPESQPAMPGSENQKSEDAIDIVPGGAGGGSDPRDGADMDIVAAARARMAAGPQVPPRAAGKR